MRPQHPSNRLFKKPFCVQRSFAISLLTCGFPITASSSHGWLFLEGELANCTDWDIPRSMSQFLSSSLYRSPPSSDQYRLSELSSHPNPSSEYSHRAASLSNTSLTQIAPLDLSPSKIEPLDLSNKSSRSVPPNGDRPPDVSSRTHVTPTAFNNHSLHDIPSCQNDVCKHYLTHRPIHLKYEAYGHLSHDSLASSTSILKMRPRDLSLQKQTPMLQELSKPDNESSSSKSIKFDGTIESNKSLRKVSVEFNRRKTH